MNWVAMASVVCHQKVSNDVAKLSWSNFNRNFSKLYGRDLESGDESIIVVGPMELIIATIFIYRPNKCVYLTNIIRE